MGCGASKEAKNDKPADKKEDDKPADQKPADDKKDEKKEEEKPPLAAPPPTTEMAMLGTAPSKYGVFHSAELMKNYQTEDVLQPQKKFIALQTSTGQSLLFVIGTDDKFNLIIESQAKTATGWELHELCKSVFDLFPGQNPKVTTFAAAQVVPAGGDEGTAKIHVAMVVGVGNESHLYISLNNSDSNLDWAKSPQWTACPFNAKDAEGKPITPPNPLAIADITVSQARDAEYVVVDTLKHPDQPTTSTLVRWRLALDDPSTPVWTILTLPADIENTHYITAIGRAENEMVDALYTAGKVANVGQLIYTPLYNAFSPLAPPASRRLKLPNDEVPTAMASVRLSSNASDLFVMVEGKLYYFAASNQVDGSTPTLISTDETLYATASKMYAYQDDGHLTVWGLNRNNQVFYVTAPAGEATDPTKWSDPVPILDKVDAVSPYVDRNYSANTIFAHTANGLMKHVKSPATGLWACRNITLPPKSKTQNPRQISTYTTHIEVTVTATGERAPGITVAITSPTVTAVRINHLYYTIGPKVVNVETDRMGQITVVETVTGVSGARLSMTLADDGDAVVNVNPMNSAMQRNAAYDSKDALKDATITDPITGHTRKLITADVKDETYEAMASSNKNLKEAYADKGGDAGPQMMHASRMWSGGARPAAPKALGGSSWISRDFGDLANWLLSGIEAVIDIVKDVASGAWHFIATIAGKVYAAVLDTVEAVVGAVTWIYNQVKVLIEDIIAFLEFLLAWGDILDTHKVLKHITKLMANHTVDQIETLKPVFRTAFQSMETALNQLLGVTFPDTPLNKQSKANRSNTTAPQNIGMHHYQNGAKDAKGSGDIPPGPPSVLDALKELVNREKDTISTAAHRVKTEIIDKYNQLSLAQLVTTLLAIVGDALIETASNLVMALIDVLASALSDLLEILDKTIDVPVLSWLYHLITGSDLSILDLLCLIAAIPTTLILKGLTGKAPFPSDGAVTKQFLGASTFKQFLAGIQVSPKVSRRLRRGDARGMARAAATATEEDDDSLSESRAIWEVCAGVFAFCGTIVLNITLLITASQEAIDDRGDPDPYLDAVTCVGTIFWAAPNFSEYGQLTAWYAIWNDAVTILVIARTAFAIKYNGDTASKIYPYFDTIINILWEVPVIAGEAEDTEEDTALHLATAANTLANFSGALELPRALALEASQPEAYWIIFGAQEVTLFAYGVIAMARGAYIYDHN